MKKKYEIEAFSLAEILVVLAIMGILIMLVVPNNAGVAARAKAIEAKQELMLVYNLQNAHFLEYSKYSNDFDKLGYRPQRTTKVGGNANYELQVVEVSNDNFQIQATAVNDFDGDGVFNVWVIDKNGMPEEKQAD